MVNSHVKIYIYVLCYIYLFSFKKRDIYIKWIYKHTVWNSDAVKTALENVRSGSLLSHSKRRHIESSWTPPSFTHTLRPYPDKRMDVDLTTNNLFSKGRKRARLQKISEIREPDSECV